MDVLEKRKRLTEEQLEKQTGNSSCSRALNAVLLEIGAVALLHTPKNYMSFDKGAAALLDDGRVFVYFFDIFTYMPYLERASNDASVDLSQISASIKNEATYHDCILCFLEKELDQDGKVAMKRAINAFLEKACSNKLI